MIRLETATHYYLLAAQQDLFGRWELWRAWGRKATPLGHRLRTPADSLTHAEQLLAEQLARHTERGYLSVPLLHLKPACSTTPASVANLTVSGSCREPPARHT